MKNRLEKVKKKMASMDISALLVSKGENQLYLSGYHSSDCDIVITKDKNYLLTDFRYIEVARELSPLFDAILTDHQYTLNTFLQELEPNRLAIEEKIVSVASYKELKDAIHCEIISGDGIVESIRVIKEESEIDSIVKAQALADLCFSHMLTYLRPGLTELEVAFEIEASYAKMARRDSLLILSAFPVREPPCLTENQVIRN
jgi:Xaa-Pro aminopeptidase